MNPEDIAITDPSDTDYWGGAGDFLHALENQFTQIGIAAVNTIGNNAVNSLQQDNTPASLATPAPATSAWPFTAQQTIIGVTGLIALALVLRAVTRD